MESYESIILLILSIITLFFGYRLKKIAFAILWFIIGYRLANFVLAQEFVIGLNFPEFIMTILPFCIGLLGALMGTTIEKICISALVMIATVTIVLENYGFSLPTLGIALIIGTVLGCVTCALMKPAIILITALTSAQTLALSATSLFSLTAPSFVLFGINMSLWFLIIFVILAVIGTGFQFKNTKNIE